ncbi:MAG: hypothetical protein V2A76_00590 [Planctomycetota bacterium]
MLPLLVLFTLAPRQEVEQEQLDRAIELFRMHESEDQQAIVLEIASRIEQSEDPGVRSLLSCRDRARRQLRIKPWPGPEYYEPSVYAPVQRERSFVPRDSPSAEEQDNLMRPWDNATEYSCRIRYDYAGDHAWDLGADPAPEEKLLDYLGGYPPDADLLIAWPEGRFDHDRSLNKIADYFGHAYCDRDGNCYSEITIYDAFASQNQIEMSDVDVIAYARNVLHDSSYRSPIPADRRRQELYDKIKDGFLLHYRSRVMTEAAANLFVNPETVLRSDHEGLRERLLVTFAMAQSDVDRIATSILKADTRDKFIVITDDLIEKDRKRLAAGYEWSRARISSRWAIAREAYAVLREHGLLHRL